MRGDADLVLVHRVLETVGEDNEQFLRGLRDRLDKVGVELPKIEVRFENLSVEGDAYVGRRALPTLLNAALNGVEAAIEALTRIPLSKKTHVKVLTNVTGLLCPSRTTLLLGPPGSGRTTLLKALAGQLDKSLQVSGRITYCGHELSQFVPQRTCAYIAHHHLHNGEMTVRETLDFSARCMGVGIRREILSELMTREGEAGITPDPLVDAFMKATALEGQSTNLATDYILKVLGLDICADTIVGDDMRRGISGDQKKRLTTGEMLVGPARALFMDEISTGLDSSTTFEIVKFIRQTVHIMDGTVMMSLLQPAPETFNLFDDIVLLSEGQIVYQGPRENILEFFEFVGFKCPGRKGVADFLQEAISKKDQEQYWCRTDRPYKYVSVGEFIHLFGAFHVGERLRRQLLFPCDRSRSHPAALATMKYGISKWKLFKACLSREWLLMKRSWFVYVFKTCQVTILSIITTTTFLRTEMHHETIADGGKFLGALFFSVTNLMFNGMAELYLTVQRLPMFYKQRDFFFFPPWAFAFPIWLLRIPVSLLESAIWVVLTYYAIGYAPDADRFFKQFLALTCIHQMALSLFRCIAAFGRTIHVANTIAAFAFIVIFALGGFVISRDDIQPWWIWAYYLSPMMYGLNSLTINEFLDRRWKTPNTEIKIDAPTVGKAFLKSRGLFTEDYSYWICIGAVVGFSILYNTCFIAALTFINPFGNSHIVIIDQDKKNKPQKASFYKEQSSRVVDMVPLSDSSFITGFHKTGMPDHAPRRAVILPFQPHSLAFNHISYYVEMPSEMKNHGIKENRLRLLSDVSGAFRPGILTALVGVSGAGKTTLLDVLAGRKTGGCIEGSINISGYPKNQATFARISGYCEQNDIHSPHVTVYESLIYSALLRLPPEVNSETRQMFVEEILELIELSELRDTIVGLPGVSGLSTEQRKRLTIAVELVANPSIIFMDEPTSGLDARAAAIVMRTVRNTVDTGRTVVCTIHQPSIDIFESFDELLLMKIGGQVIYAGSLGQCSHDLMKYFEEIPGIPKIKSGYNPATWMLEITTPSMEAHLNLDFAKAYAYSSLYQQNQQFITELSTPIFGSKDISFPTIYSQNFCNQCISCFWKQHLSYWRNPPYNNIRFCMTFIIGLIFGTIFWNLGQKIDRQQDLLNLIGATYAALFFVGAGNSTTVQPVVATERTVFYRERAAGMYSALAYAFAQVSIEVVYVAIQSVIYALPLFFMIGYPWQASKFFWFVYFIFMSFLYFTLYGMMAVALTPGYQIAATVMSFCFGLWNLFSGFLIFRPLIPVWWRWYYWASPLAWTIYGVLVSQLGDLETLVDIPGRPSMTVKAFLRNIAGLDRDFLAYVALAHIAFVFIFFFTFSYGIKHLNFQKR